MCAAYCVPVLEVLYAEGAILEIVRPFCRHIWLIHVYAGLLSYSGKQEYQC